MCRILARDLRFVRLHSYPPLDANKLGIRPEKRHRAFVLHRDEYWRWKKINREYVKDNETVKTSLGSNSYVRMLHRKRSIFMSDSIYDLFFIYPVYTENKQDEHMTILNVQKEEKGTTKYPRENIYSRNAVVCFSVGGSVPIDMHLFIWQWWQRRRRRQWRWQRQRWRFIMNTIYLDTIGRKNMVCTMFV